MNKHARQLYDVLRGNRKSKKASINLFDMASWGDGCGSAMCIGGTANSMFGDRLVFDAPLHEFLGLGSKEWDILCFSIRDLNDPGPRKRLHTAIWGDVLDPYTLKGPDGAKRAATALRRACELSAKRKKK